MIERLIYDMDDTEIINQRPLAASRLWVIALVSAIASVLSAIAAIAAATQCG